MDAANQHFRSADVVNTEGVHTVRVPYESSAGPAERMRYYAILDTNVLVSAMLKTGSVPGQVLAEALNGDIIPVLNDGIIAEYVDVMNRPKFRFDKRAECRGCRING